ncbi:lipopolysaccharide biosynthesis protein [Sphingomonas arantia]|uniref:Lipopolysaccharide biosynthesis protein n=1 Tax=Sphingomonas arantia TaxID=1460676 RepID=A0ABW4U584_9SPHN
MTAFRHWLVKHRMFALVVLLPGLLVTAYYYGIASNQYESEADFVIRSSDNAGASAGGLGAMLGMAGGITSSQSEAMGVSDYLKSHEVIEILRKRLGLVERFRRPEVDAISILRPANPTPETLEKYYNQKVTVEYDRDTGISRLRVRAFRPDDSYAIIRSLLTLGEQQVNQLNQRTYRDAVSSARAQLAEAETGVAEIQNRMTGFRQTRQDIDPAGTGAAQIQMVSTMTASLSAARAQLSAMRSMISTSSPQYQALAQRVSSLERELALQSGKLTGGNSTIASSLGSYEDLKVRQDFAAKRYEAAAANLEKAREQASRQQLYLVRIVEPNKPVKSEYPERGRIVLTVILGLLIAYGIGWLLAAGVREHVA